MIGVCGEISLRERGCSPVYAVVPLKGRIKFKGADIRGRAEEGKSHGCAGVYGCAEGAGGPVVGCVAGTGGFQLGVSNDVSGALGELVAVFYPNFVGVLAGIGMEFQVVGVGSGAAFGIDVAGVKEDVVFDFDFGGVEQFEGDAHAIKDVVVDFEVSGGIGDKDGGTVAEAVGDWAIEVGEDVVADDGVDFGGDGRLAGPECDAEAFVLEVGFCDFDA